ncbi:MAG: MotA/TolQ/ExbB proton channel family protein [Alphaproteobacteria bacterium]
MSLTKAPYYIMLSSPSSYVWRMILFVVVAALFGLVLYDDILVAYKANIWLNSIILMTLGVGILYTVAQVIRLNPEIRWVNNFRGSDSGARMPEMLAPMATLLQRHHGQGGISATTMRSLLDSIASRLDESRETTRYLVGLLVFLGLLGTFWGLMQTVNSVSVTIQGIQTTGDGVGAGFEKLKEGLTEPLKGMGVAFSASLFGLAGSLIVGFLDLQASHAQTRFFNELEEWLSGISELAPETAGAGGNQPAQLRFAMLDMQRSVADLVEKLDVTMSRNNSSEAMLELSRGIDRLVKQMRSEQSIVREWVDEQSNRQQNELASVLREQSRLATILRDVAGRSPRGDER